MNSLTYLSRQFDVLASPKTSLSTPTKEDFRQFSSSSEPHLKRVKTWSNRPFFAQGASSSVHPKRSHSSPTVAALATTTSSMTETKHQKHTESLISRIFYLRVLALAWDSFRAAWTSLINCGLLRRDANNVVILEKKSLIFEESSESSDDESPPLTARSPTSSSFRTHFNSDPISFEPKQPNPAITVHPPPDSASSTRSVTPVQGARKTPFHSQKTLVLDLDETLIHSTTRPISTANSSGLFGFGARKGGPGHVVEVMLGGRSTLYHVYKRPFVDFFLRTVSGWYTLVIFTASMKEYADPVIDWLDAGRGILDQRLFRDSCTQLPNGSYTKDLSVVEPDLARVCLIDNSPISYRVNEANGIPIEGWTHDPSDEALLDLLPVLDSLRFTSDVRRVVGLRNATGSRGLS
ncbi:NLI interacting factor-like phosphatase-domain-containing protein [Lentinula aciculospora]|uniref:NLI interacting factor-like phosphatase-domain-containing protein n=1 Tax=Lentinula aciculospora TaxID=153920 RepID=A0A9W9DEQ6_9AGAR|nr:NLI interacting factor-like phosphatase-domain-containing protein [Lentinula aciculospora]